MRTGIRYTALPLLVVFILGAASARAQFTANSLSQLRALSGLDNATITMSPGEYWISGDRPDAAYLNFSGTNSTFDFSQATFKIDTRDIAGYRDESGSNADFDIVRLSGTGVTVQGLTLYGEDVDLDTDPDARRFPNRGAAYVQVSGSNNTLLDADISTRGSNPYGLGEAFGKGGRQFPQGEPPGQVEGEEEGVIGLPWIGHNKVSGVHVWEASNATVENLNLSMQTYGHGLFIQKASDTIIRDSAITGELFPASNVENHPLYIEYGNITSQGVPIPAGIEYSGHEDGIRAYGSIDGVPVTNITVENTVVTNMRNAYSTALARGDINLTNVEAYASELGFAVNGDTTIAGGKGDIVNGPLLWYYNDGSDNDIELELVGGQPVGVDYSVAYVAGYDSSFTLTSDAGADLLPEDSVIRLGQVYFENWRDSNAPSGPEDGTAQPMSNSRFTNNTNRMVVIGESATRNVGYSLAPVISNGKENYYDGVTLVQAGSRLMLSHNKGLGNSGTETGADFSGNNIIYTGTPTSTTFNDNGSIVEDGATLELLPGLSIVDEKLTLTGDGVDGNGALYSDGQTGTGTRFGDSTSGNESTIFLAGNASIGVGIAGNQLLVGSIQGTGNLTKRGPGTLTIEKSSPLNGTVFVSQGTLAARSNVSLGDVTVESGGTLAPGNSAGSLTTGDLALLTDSTLEIELGGLLAGSEYDQLLSDAVSLGGDLAISLLDLGAETFTPDFSDTFTVLSASSLTGAFDNVAAGERLVTAGFEGSFLVTYDSVTDEVLLSEFLANLLGDLDGDGNINVADWTQFKAGSNIDLSGFTAEVAYQHGDLNGDFVQNLTDFAIFQSSFDAANGPGAFAAILAVPEPSAIAGCCLALVMLVAGNLRCLQHRG